MAIHTKPNAPVLYWHSKTAPIWSITTTAVVSRAHLGCVLVGNTLNKIITGEASTRNSRGLKAAQIQLATRNGNPLARQYVFFSRAGFTEPAQAQALARSKGAMLMDLIYLDEVLAAAIR